MTNNIEPKYNNIATDIKELKAQKIASDKKSIRDTGKFKLVYPPIFITNIVCSALAIVTRSEVTLIASSVTCVANVGYVFNYMNKSSKETNRYIKSSRQASDLQNYFGYNEEKQAKYYFQAPNESEKAMMRKWGRKPNYFKKALQEINTK